MEFAAKYGKPLLLAAGLLFLMSRWAGSRPVHHPPGIPIPDPPQQTAVPPGKTAWKVGDTVIAPLAAYRISARVLHRERYRWEGMADLAPVDLGVGWNLMSDERYVSQVSFSNSNRFLSWFWNSSDFLPD